LGGVSHLPAESDGQNSTLSMSTTELSNIWNKSLGPFEKAGKNGRDNNLERAGLIP
jgi:hypothetical protein